MAIQSIQLPGYRPKKPSMLEQIALGVDTAAKVLGTGIQAYKVFGVEKPEADARANYYNTESATKLAPNYMLANDADIAANKGHEVPGGEEGQLYVPRQEDQWQNAANLHQTVAAGKAGDNENKAFYKAKQDLEQLRGNPGLQVANRNILLGRNYLSALGPYAQNPNGVPTDILGLASIEEAKLASGGVPQKEELNAISDPTLYKDLSALKSKIMNIPVGAGQAEFLGNHIRYVNELINNSKDIISRSYNRKLDDWKSRLSPDDYKILKGNMEKYLSESDNIGPKTQESPSGNAVIAAPVPSGSGPHGPTVTQGGHTYNWNPQTKQYE